MTMKIWENTRNRLIYLHQNVGRIGKSTRCVHLIDDDWELKKKKF